MNNKSTIFIIGIILILVGLTKLDVTSVVKPNPQPTVVNFVEPKSDLLKEKAKKVVEALSADSDRKIDGQRLASLYNDIATLIALDGDDEAVKNTEEVRQANRLSGIMLKLNIKGKYENLSTATNELVISAIGDDVLLLDSELRAKSVEAFQALAWACNEGSK